MTYTSRVLICVATLAATSIFPHTLKAAVIGSSSASGLSYDYSIGNFPSVTSRDAFLGAFYDYSNSLKSVKATIQLSSYADVEGILLDASANRGVGISLFYDIYFGPLSVGSGSPSIQNDVEFTGKLDDFTLPVFYSCATCISGSTFVKASAFSSNYQTLSFFLPLSVNVPPGIGAHLSIVATLDDPKALQVSYLRVFSGGSVNLEFSDTGQQAPIDEPSGLLSVLPMMAVSMILLRRRAATRSQDVETRLYLEPLVKSKLPNQETT